MSEKKDKASKDHSDSQTPAVFNMSDRPDIADFMAAAGTGRRQPMQGFDEDYVDIVDYIIRCTHKIWEQKGIGLIYTHYAHIFSSRLRTVSPMAVMPSSQDR